MKPVLLRGHEKPITAVKFNFDGDLLFTASGERKINVWYSMSGERIGSYEPLAAVRTLDVTNDSKYLVVGTNVGTLELFKVEGGQRVGFIDIKARFKTVQLSYGDKKLLALVEWYSTDDKKGLNEILVYDFDDLVKTFSSSSGADAVTLKPESILLSKSKYCQISWGLLNKSIIAAREDGYVEIIDLNGTILKSAKVHQERINSFSISKEFAFIVTNSNEGSKLLDPEDLTILKTFKTEVPMNSGCVSPLAFEEKGSKYHGIIAGGVAAREAAGLKLGGFEVRIVNLVHEEEIGRIAGHFGPVNTLAFYPDGRGFVSGGEEGIVRLFRFDEKYFKNFE